MGIPFDRGLLALEQALGDETGSCREATLCAPIEKNDFTGFTKAGKKIALGSPACSATSMGKKGGTASWTTRLCAKRDRYLC